MLTVQAYNYFENFPKDPIWNKIIVSSFFGIHSKRDFDGCDYSGSCRLVWTEPNEFDAHETLILLNRCMDSFHLGLICQAVHHYLVTNWGYAPALATSTWELNLQLTFIGISSFICQLFFLNRCAPLPPKPSRFLNSDERAGFGFSAAEITSSLGLSLPSALQRLS